MRCFADPAGNVHGGEESGTDASLRVLPWVTDLVGAVQALGDRVVPVRVP